jgi:hypothetical protein
MNGTMVALIERLGSLGLLALVLFGIYRFVTGRVGTVLDRIATRLDTMDVRLTAVDVRLVNGDEDRRGLRDGMERALRRLERIQVAVDADPTGIRTTPTDPRRQSG